MATGSIEVLKNEKYMDDAFSSVFSNLHRMAKRKNDSVWSMTKFDSLNSIWGDIDEPKTHRMHEKDDFEKNETKIRWKVMPSDVSDDTKSTEMPENYSEDEAKEESLKMEWRVSRENRDKRGKYQTEQNLLFDVKSNHQSLGGLNLPREFVSHREPSPERVDSKENKPKLEVVAARQQSGRKTFEETRANLSEENSSRLMCGKDVVEKMTRNVRENAQRKKHPSYIKDVARHRLQQNSSPNENSLYQENTDCGIKYIDGTMKDRPEISKVRYQQTSKSPVNSSLSELTSVRQKRTRHDSGSSSNSKVPLQKMHLRKAEHREASSFDTGRTFLNTMLSVRIIKDVQWSEFTADSSDFNRIKRKFPKISEVLPDVDAGEKEIPFSFDAVKTVFGFLFNRPCNFNTMPEGRIGVEVLAAIKLWNLKQFYENCQSHFLEKVTKSNFRAIYPLASHFGLREICDACKTFSPDKKSLNEASVKPRKCSVVVYRYIEPSEYDIPLETVHQELHDSFDRDIRNIVIFEAVSNDFDIPGFRILLDAGDVNREAATLDISYRAKIVNSNSGTEEIEVTKPFRSNIVIYFKKKITVKKGQKLQISVETTIKPQLCFATGEDFITNKSGAEFNLTLDSTYKVKQRGVKRFFIGKLLYNALEPID